MNESEAGFLEYRKEMVRDYIDDMYRTIRQTGAKQPVSWCCNWHRMIVGHEDVFEAISESEVEVVSFCNYPGQSVCKHPYYDNPENLTRHDYTDWYIDCYTREDYYAWALTPAFRNKAKVVYEFETMYNQSAYLYPVMADFFRAMGVQMAAMWHYSMPAYARYRRGSHVLNLKCTPAKAASFAVAGKIFEETPILLPYHTVSTTEWTSERFAYSYEKDMSIFSDDEHYYYSASIDDRWQPKPEPGIRHIFGCGSSPLVDYTGNGNYQLTIREDELDIMIQPDIRHQVELWDKNTKIRGHATQFVRPRQRTLKLDLEGWGEGSYTLFRVEDDGREISIGRMRETRLFVVPGHYKIVRNK